MDAAETESKYNALHALQKELEEEGKKMKLELDTLRQMERKGLRDGVRCLELTDKVNQLELDLGETKTANVSLHSQLNAYKNMLDNVVKEQSERLHQVIDKQRLAGEQSDQELRAALEAHLNAGFTSLEKLNTHLGDRLVDKDKQLAALKEENLQLDLKVREGRQNMDELNNLNIQLREEVNAQLSKLESETTLTKEQHSNSAAEASKMRAIIRDLQGQLRQHGADAAKSKTHTTHNWDMTTSPPHVQGQSDIPVDSTTSPSSSPRHRASAKRTSANAFTPDENVPNRKAYGRPNNSQGSRGFLMVMSAKVLQTELSLRQLEAALLVMYLP